MDADALGEADEGAYYDGGCAGDLCSAQGYLVGLANHFKVVKLSYKVYGERLQRSNI